jgi:hypothetical protein
MECVTAFLSAGNPTMRYPLEVQFELLQRKSGDPIVPYSVGMSIGYTTAMASYWVCIAMLEVESWCPGAKALVYDLVGQQVLSCIRLHARWLPAADVSAMIRNSLGGKIQASNRQRPSPLQMLRALGHKVRQVAAANPRKAGKAVWDEVLSTYNKSEGVKNNRLNGDELNAVKLLNRASDAFLNHIRIIWGTDKLEWTAVPLNLIGAKFLREESDLAVDAKKSPKWFAILQVTEEKRVLWLMRVDGRFQVKAGTRA